MVILYVGVIPDKDRRAGLWAVDDHEYYTPPKLLVIKGDLLQGFSMPADYDETVRLQGRKTSTPQGEGCGRSAHRLTAGVGAFRWMVASTSTWLPTRCSGGGCWTHSPSARLQSKLKHKPIVPEWPALSEWVAFSDIHRRSWLLVSATVFSSG